VWRRGSRKGREERRGVVAMSCSRQAGVRKQSVRNNEQ